MPNRALSILAAAGTAAALSYFFDRQQGRRRRAIVRDKVTSKLCELDDAGRLIAVDLAHRTRGFWAGLRQRFHPEDVPDEVLAERVRARLGRVVSHPGSIE